MGNKIKVGNFLDVKKNKVSMPKVNGRVPEVGEKITMKEVRYFSRGNQTYTIEKGEHIVTGFTSCLVLCEKKTSSNTSYATSYLISDFKAGLIVYDVLTNENAEKKFG